MEQYVTAPKKVQGKGYHLQAKVLLVKGGKEYFDKLCYLISSARESIHIQMYTFSYDETGKTVIAWLKEASTRGVQIYLLFDGYATHFPKELLQDISGTTIYLKRFKPLLKTSIFFIGRRLHHKIVVADTHRAMVGSNNINNHYRGTSASQAWFDMALYVEGSAASELEKVCIQLWNSEAPRIRHLAPSDISSEDQERGAISVRVRRNDWARLKPEISNSYFHLLNKAKKQVCLVSSYFLPGRRLRKQIKLAVERGVNVSVVTAGLSDVKIAKQAERYLYSWLLRNRVVIYEYQHSILHAKLGIRDSKWLTLGSFNINNISAYASIELNLDVRSKPFVTEVESELEKLIVQNCVCITQHTLSKKQTFLNRIIQRASYNIIRIALYLFTFYFRRGR